MTNLIERNNRVLDQFLVRLDNVLSIIESCFQFDSLQRAKRKIKAEKLKEAIGVLKRKAEKTLDSAECYYLLGICYERLHCPNQAEHYFHLTLAIEQNHLGAAAGLARIYFDQGLDSKARCTLSRMRRLRC